MRLKCLHSFALSSNQHMSAYHMSNTILHTGQQRAKHATLMETWDTNKVVADSKELKQEDVMEIDLLIRKDVSEWHDRGQAPRQGGAHNSKIGGTEFQAGRQTSARP